MVPNSSILLNSIFCNSSSTIFNSDAFKSASYFQFPLISNISFPWSIPCSASSISSRDNFISVCNLLFSSSDFLSNSVALPPKSNIFVGESVLSAFIYGEENFFVFLFPVFFLQFCFQACKVVPQFNFRLLKLPHQNTLRVFVKTLRISLAKQLLCMH